MQTVNIKRKEFNIKNPTRLIVEDEVKAESIQFAIQEASSINNYESLTFYLQYRNNLGEYGFEHLDHSYDSTDDRILLFWEPSALFTKERGKVEIQIVGQLSFYAETTDAIFIANKDYYVISSGFYTKLEIHTDGHTAPYAGQSITEYKGSAGVMVYEYISQTRWSTIKTAITLSENIIGTEIDLPDTNYIEKALADMHMSIVENREISGTVKGYMDTTKGYMEAAQSAVGEAEAAVDRASGFADLAQQYSLDAQAALRNTEELRDYLEKYTTKAYRTTIGDGRSSYTVIHNLGTYNIILQLWKANEAHPIYRAEKIDQDIIQIDFAEPIYNNEVDVVISAIDYSDINQVDIVNVQNLFYMSPEEALTILSEEGE